jgi:hypothetical protein
VRTGRTPIVAVACLIGLGALAAQCGSSPQSPAPAPAPAKPAPPSLESTLTPTLTVKELMEHIIDPTADWVFDAAVVDVTAKGVVETKPLTDDDWLKVERGGLLLAESMNLLKMHRKVAPPVQPSQDNAPHKGAEPELPAEQIQAKIDQDRALWNKYADGLRDAALNSVKVARARDAEALFTVGSEIDKACENCHLEYWYPGDRKAVLEDQNKKVTYDPPKKADPAKKK